LYGAVEAKGTFKAQSNFDRYDLKLIHLNGDGSRVLASAVLQAVASV
jgi:hypothetical protein